MRDSFRKEFEDKRRNICFELALKLEGGRYDDALHINKVNSRYKRLLDSCISETDILLVEKRLFEEM